MEWDCTRQQFDTGLLQYYLRSRFYANGAGRFTTRDTFQGSVEDPRTLSSYAYTADDPVNKNDPTGHDGNTLSSLVVTSVQMTMRGIQTVVAWAIRIWARFMLLISSALAALQRGWAQFTSWLTNAVQTVSRMPYSVWQRLTQFFSRVPSAPTQAQSAAQGVGSNRALVTAWQRLIGGWSTNGDLQVHHFVLQHARNITQFGVRAVQSVVNSTPISSAYHRLITSFYNSGAETLNFMNNPPYSRFSTVWRYVQTLNWERQWQWGWQVYNYVLQNGSTSGFDPHQFGL